MPQKASLTHLCQILICKHSGWLSTDAPYTLECLWLSAWERRLDHSFPLQCKHGPSQRNVRGVRRIPH